MKSRVIICMILLLIFCNSNSIADSKKRVFILASYEKEHVCGSPQEQGILNGLSKQGWFNGLNLEVESYYMDTKRNNNTLELMKQQAAIALKRIDAFRPEVLVTIDDNAFREVGLQYANHSEISVVFSGLNGQPEEYHRSVPFMIDRRRPGRNITGVYEKLYIQRSLEVIQRAIPKSRGSKFVGITDFSPTGNAVIVQFNIELKGLPEGITWETKRVKNWDEYTRLIKQINNDDDVIAIYPAALKLETENDGTYTAPEIFEWTIKNSKKPEMAVNYYFSKMGLFGGAAVDFQSMGFLAGKKAGKILNGAKAGTLSIDDAPDYAIVFNIQRARTLGIEIPFPLLTAADDIYK